MPEQDRQTCIVCWEIDPPDGGLWDDDGFVCHRCDLGACVEVECSTS